MKRILSTLLLFLLVAAMLVSCGKKPNTPQGGGDDDPTDTPKDVTDSGSPLKDPTSGSVIGSVSDAGATFLTQIKLPYNGNGTEQTGMISLFPNADLIIAKDRADSSIYGVYGWSREYLEYYDDLDDIGFDCLRLGAPSQLTDEIMDTICDSGISVMLTMGRPIYSSEDNKHNYLKDASKQETVSLDTYDIAGWLKYNIEVTLGILAQYGPNGTYFQSHPNANYNPVRYIEIYNEPNFQYMMPNLGNSAANHPAKAKLYLMLQIAEYTAVKHLYGDEVKIVGFGAGGADGLDKAFFDTSFALQNNAEMKALLNAAIAGDDGSATPLRSYLGLGEAEELEFDAIGTMDILSTHPYWSNSPFAQDSYSKSMAYYLDNIRTSIKKAYVTKFTAQYIEQGYTEEDAKSEAEAKAEKLKLDLPIWYTECGWQLKGRANVKAYLDANGLSTADFDPQEWGNVTYNKENPLAGYGTGVDQMTQAAMHVQCYIFGLRCGVDRITYMHMQDTDGCNYGLFNYLSGGTAGTKEWRQTCYAIQVMTTLMPNPKLVKVLQEGLVTGSKTDYAYIYEFESDIGGENVIVAFAAQAAQTLFVDWDEDYALVTDMLGTTKIVAAENGKIKLDGGPYMMYIRHVDNQTLIEHGYIPSAQADAAPTAYAWVETKHDEL